MIFGLILRMALVFAFLSALSWLLFRRLKPHSPVDLSDPELQEKVRGLLSAGENLRWLARVKYQRAVAFRTVAHDYYLKAILLAGTDSRLLWVGVAHSGAVSKLKERAVTEVKWEMPSARASGWVEYTEHSMSKREVLLSAVELT